MEKDLSIILSKRSWIRKFVHDTGKADFNSFICLGEYEECYFGNYISLQCKKLNEHGTKRVELFITSYKRVSH